MLLETVTGESKVHQHTHNSIIVALLVGRPTCASYLPLGWSLWLYQDIKYDFTTELTGTGDRSEYDIEDYY